VRLLLAVAVLAQLAGCGMGTPTPRTIPDDSADRVREVDRTRFRAMVENDIEHLDTLLADDLVYVHTTGDVESKPEFLQRLRSGSLRYRSIEPKDVRVRTYGNTAVVTGRSHVAVTNRGADRELDMLYTAVYTANGGRWQLASWQSTTLAASATMTATKPHARIDHIILGAADLDRATHAFERMTGVRPIYGGKHPTGTHNALVSLGGQTYLEIIAAQPGAPAPDWLPNLADLEDPTPVGWAITADDGAALRRDLVAAGFVLTENRPGARTTPSGATLNWQTFRFAGDIKQMPFFILWAPETQHPSAASPSGCKLARFTIASPQSEQLNRLRNALDLPVEVSKATTLELSCPNGHVIFKPR
jgi:ketosteroid isomerase-like protein/catechol 2,3-dioxygenase-like lactoylglutathione lyase family enzyme